MNTSLSRTTRRAALIACAALALAACGDDPVEPGPDSGTPPDAGTDAAMAGNSIVDIAAGNPDFSMLVAAATRAGLVETLGAGEFTVFAPTNDAFEASGITMAMIEAMPEMQLRGLLTYHALVGSITASELEAGPATTAAMLSIILGTTDGVTINGGNDVVGGANVVMADIEASNGVIHVIDRVLLPPTVADLTRYAGLTTLAGAVTTAGLADDLSGAGPFTVFAPTDAAFAALPAVPTGDALTSVLLYHVVGARVPAAAVPATAASLSENEYGDMLTLLFDTEGGVTINDGVMVVVADVFATNGIVHVVDEVLLPMNVVEAATAAGLTGLLGAVTAAADLGDGTSVAEALAAQAPYTVFAPSNDAFTAAAGTISTLDAEQVRDVLLFHVLDPAVSTSPVLAADLPAAEAELETLDPDATNTVTFAPGPPPTVEGAAIVITDIVVTNGVVHVIDAVMVPPTL
ncbi:MAG: fasciclin domain-containing protein [Myxococcota bacterium]|nr:fasciclin domain-containing protein [Myxococcota bacterium]